MLHDVQEYKTQFKHLLHSFGEWSRSLVSFQQHEKQDQHTISQEKQCGIQEETKSKIHILSKTRTNSSSNQLPLTEN